MVYFVFVEDVTDGCFLIPSVLLYLICSTPTSFCLGGKSKTSRMEKVKVRLDRDGLLRPWHTGKPSRPLHKRQKNQMGSGPEHSKPGLRLGFMFRKTCFDFLCLNLDIERTFCGRQ